MEISCSVSTSLFAVFHACCMIAQCEATSLFGLRSLGRLSFSKRDGDTDDDDADSRADLKTDSPGVTQGHYKLGELDPDVMKRMLYLMLGLTLVAVLFFVYRTVRGKGRRKTKKYGVLATPNTEVELRPLEEEDDEEDVTVFDANSK